MKSKKLLLSIVLITSLIARAQSDSTKFPVGAYINNVRHTNYPQVTFLNINSAVQYADSINQNDLSVFDEIIASNLDNEYDFIHHYTGGYHTKWEIGLESELQPDDKYPGFKAGNNTIGTTYDNYKVVYASNPNIGGYLLYGPHYYQDKKYRLLYKSSNTVNYKAVFRLRIDGQHDPKTPVCKILVEYLLPDGQLIQDPLYQKVLTAGEITNNYTEHEIMYSYPLKEQKENGILIYPETTEEDSEFTPADDEELIDGAMLNSPSGIQFNVQWLSPITLYVDYIEVYDILIGSVFIENMPRIISRCNSYLNKYKAWSNLKYWYSLDEPKSIDSYEPYRKIQIIINNFNDSNNTKFNLITAYYPEWNGYQDNEIKMKRWVEEVNPQKVLYYYYPFWPGKATTEGLHNQRTVLQQPFNENGFNLGNYYFVAQAHGFWKYNDYGVLEQTRRFPDTCELKASVMLALAHGVKGLLFWNYYSYNQANGTDPRCQGIVGHEYSPTPLFTYIKNLINNRLYNILGETLLKVNYTGNYIYYVKDSEITREIYQAYDNLEYVNIILNNSFEKYQFHISQLQDTLDPVNSYYFINNLIHNSSRSIDIEVMKPSLFTNFILKNIENSISYSFTNQLSLNLYLPPGEGYLYQIAPVVKYGGDLIANETISSAITLTEPMTIKAQKTLTVATTYTVKKDITVETGGSIASENLITNIKLTDGAALIYNSNNWGSSLLNCWENNHPKLVWGKHPNAVGYKIYKKKGSAPFGIIQTVSANKYDYIDQNETAVLFDSTQSTKAYYYVDALFVSPESPVSSNTIDFDVSQAPYTEKKTVQSGEEELPTEFSLEQNYPNPFNPETTIEFRLPKDCHVKLELYDVLGNKIADLAEGYYPAGAHTKKISMNDYNLTSGVYFYRITAGDFVMSRKMVLMK